MKGRRMVREKAVAELERPCANLTEARTEVARAVSTYNNLRPHLSVDMLTPPVAHMQQGPLKRHWKSYYREIKTEAAQAMAQAIA